MNEGTKGLAGQQIDPAITIEEIERIGREKVSEIGWFSDWTTSFRAAEDAADAFVRRRISQVTADAEAQKWIDIIKARREKLSLSSGITDQIVGICQQILAFGAAGVALT